MHLLHLHALAASACIYCICLHSPPLHASTAFACRMLMHDSPPCILCTMHLLPLHAFTASACTDCLCMPVTFTASAASPASAGIPRPPVPYT